MLNLLDNSYLKEMFWNFDGIQSVTTENFSDTLCETSSKCNQLNDRQVQIATGLNSFKQRIKHNPTASEVFFWNNSQKFNKEEKMMAEKMNRALKCDKKA